VKFFGPPVGLVLAVAASVGAHLFAWGWFLVTTCGVSDVADTFPADASPQGWTCGANATDYWHVPAVWVLGGSAILAVAFCVAVWSRGGSWRWLSPLPLVLTPLVVYAALSVPPDGCTDDARRTHTAYQCRTTPDR
jgi:hypothetical protein